MKRVKKSSAPQVLQEYVAKYGQESPLHSWKEFCKDVSAKHKVQELLREDQRGLCAYCEIDFIDPPYVVNVASKPSEPLKSDFRVEHFHPKSDGVCWELDWNNLLGVCCGGDEKFVVGGRYCRKVDRHCDYRKHDDNLDDVILNPLEIPAFPCLFKVKYGKGKDGKEESVEEGNFPQNEARLYVDLRDEKLRSLVPLKILEKAQNSIRTLRLNSSFLSRSRYEALDGIFDKLVDLTRFVGDEEEAKKMVMRDVFPKEGKWFPFFTTIRAEFGEYAEDRLKEIGYDG